MATKLSKLQRLILQLALGRASKGEPLSLREVIARRFGISDAPDPQLAQQGRVFSKAYPRYNSILAAVSRAVRRLEARGLVQRTWVRRGCSLIQLTPAGAAAVRGLTVFEAKAKSKGRRKKGSLLLHEGLSIEKRLTQEDIEAARDAEWEPVDG